MAVSPLRPLVRGSYALQKLRIQTGLRVVAQYKNNLGQTPGTKETELSAEAINLLKQLRENYNRITDGIVKEEKRTNLDKLLGGIKIQKEEGGLIGSMAEYALVQQYINLEKAENENFKLLTRELEEYPIYTQFLKNIRGIGERTAAVLISEIDIHKATYPSSLLALSGYDVVTSDGQGRSRRKEHLIKKKYLDKNGVEQEKDSITFNPFLKTKVHLMAECIIKAGGTKEQNPYAEIYRNYKFRYANHPNHKDKSKMHLHRMALRKLIKYFFISLYEFWRPLEGLECSPTYEEAKLGIIHSKVA